MDVSVANKREKLSSKSETKKGKQEDYSQNIGDQINAGYSHQDMSLNTGELINAAYPDISLTRFETTEKEEDLQSQYELHRRLWGDESEAASHKVPWDEQVMNTHCS